MSRRRATERLHGRNCLKRWLQNQNAFGLTRAFDRFRKKARKNFIHMAGGLLVGFAFCVFWCLAEIRFAPFENRCLQGHQSLTRETTQNLKNENLKIQISSQKHPRASAASFSDKRCQFLAPIVRHVRCLAYLNNVDDRGSDSPDKTSSRQKENRNHLRKIHFFLPKYLTSNLRHPLRACTAANPRLSNQRPFRPCISRSSTNNKIRKTHTLPPLLHYSSIPTESLAAVFPICAVPPYITLRSRIFIPHQCPLNSKSSRNQRLQ